MSVDIAIIDSGGANIASLLCAFERLQQSPILTRDPNIIRAAKRILLPGVGAARDAMQRLRDYGLVDVIRTLQQPVLGICLGMQLLADASEEENVECLGVIPGIATKLASDALNPVPNMGWCPLKTENHHRLLEGIDEGAYFYFLHSYALPVSVYTVASANHADAFAAIVRRKNFVAAQFHPERSSADGARLLANFLDMKA